MKKKLIYTLLFLLLCGPAFGTEIVRYVDTASAAGGDGTTDALSGGNHAYQTMSAWNTAEGQDLTDAGGDRATVYCASSDGSDDTTSFNLTGWTTSATSYIGIIGSDFPADGIWDDSAYVMSTTNDNEFMEIKEEFVRLQNLQLVVNTTVTTIFGFHIFGIGSPSDIRFDSCIIKGGTIDASTAACYGIYCNDTDATVKVSNCVFYDFIDGALANKEGIHISFAALFHTYNSVFYNCGIGLLRSTASAEVKNCVFGSCLDDMAGSPQVVDFCCGEDGDGTNSNGPESGDWANEFVDAANGDFTPLGGTGLSTAGGNDPGSGLFSTDITGESYVTDSWFRGAYAGAASTSSGQLIIISKDFWRTFLIDGINGNWKMAA